MRASDTEADSKDIILWCALCLFATGEHTQLPGKAGLQCSSSNASDPLLCRRVGLSRFATGELTQRCASQRAHKGVSTQLLGSTWLRCFSLGEGDTKGELRGLLGRDVPHCFSAGELDIEAELPQLLCGDTLSGFSLFA